MERVIALKKVYIVNNQNSQLNRWWGRILCLVCKNSYMREIFILVICQIKGKVWLTNWSRLLKRNKFKPNQWNLHQVKEKSFSKVVRYPNRLMGLLIFKLWLPKTFKQKWHQKVQLYHIKIQYTLQLSILMPTIKTT